ncbi:MAG TPA: hypothetical protein VGK82_09285, partial [Pyrinomonadaceae bacterium]
GISSSGNSFWQNKHVRRWIIYAVVLLVVFLAGLVPMWLTARTNARERDAAQVSLRISTLQNSLANAAIDARRGEYEAARQAASDFFTNLRIELERGRDSAFNEAQQNVLRTMFDKRDDTITLLARSDPASADRLVDLYTKYRQTTAVQK